MMHGTLRSGIAAVTPICWPCGRFRSLIVFTDNYRERLHEPVRLRVAVWYFDQGFKEIPEIVIDSTDGPVMIDLEEYDRAGAISLQRRDNPDAVVAWTVV